MGLLDALDSHAAQPAGGDEFEYEFHSWGEIFPPFFGDREHSVAARFILNEFPFKTFCASQPYDDPPPQKLAVTFRGPAGVMLRPGERLSPDYTAEEFAAFLSLVTRRRVFVDRLTRVNGLPMEKRVGIYNPRHAQEPQRLREIDPSLLYSLLDNLRRLDRHVGNGFVLALRLYHAAIQMFYSDPEFAYLFLVTCLESISSIVNEGYVPADPDEFADSRWPGLLKLLRQAGVDPKPVLTTLLDGEHFVFQKVAAFVERYLPDEFWTVTEDDAKPSYVFSVIGPGQDGKGEERISRSDSTLQEYEKIDRKELRRTLRNIYNARSSLIHSGIRFPASIVSGHFRLIPVEAMHEILGPTLAGKKHRPDTPPLLTFERLTSLTLVNFLKSN